MMLRHGSLQSGPHAGDRSAWCCQNLAHLQTRPSPMHVGWRHGTAMSWAAPGPSVSSRRSRATSIITRANINNDPSVKALEAAISAINKLLSAHQQMSMFRRGKNSPNGSTPGQQKGKSKVIHFSAKASSSRAVKENLVDQHAITSASVVTSAASTAVAADGGGAESSNGSTASLSAQAPPAGPFMSHTLKAYLSLPLSQYSVLDPRWISNLPDDWEQQMEQQQEQEDRIAKEEQEQEAQEAQQAQLLANSTSTAAANGIAASVAAAASNGTVAGLSSSSIEEVVSSSEGTSSKSSTTAATSTLSSSSSSNDSSMPGTEVLSIAPVDAAGMSTGVFLLKVPLQEIVGIDLKPQVVIQVHADTRNGKVTFSTSHFKLGDPRLDKDFTLDLQAHLASKVTKKPRLVEPKTPEAAAAGDGTTAAASGAASPKKIRMVPLPASGAMAGTTTAAAEPAVGEETLVMQYSGGGGAHVSPSAASAAEAQGAPTATSVLQQPHWEQESLLNCSVSLDMRLRLPHPLSIVPRPLLSTAASLVAKLTMQALLPSFLELLATDYNRWAAGSSTSSRQAVAAGSLVPAAAGGAGGSISGVQGKAAGAVVEVLEGVTTSEEEDDDASADGQGHEKQAQNGKDGNTEGAGRPAAAGSL